jgi:rubrerythrin
MAEIGIQQSLERAMEFEWEGHAFYEKAKANTEHPAAQAVFALLMEEEKKHAEYLLSLHDMYNAQRAWSGEIAISMDKDFRLLFKEAEAKIDEKVTISTSEIEALQFAHEMEQKGRAMYLELQEKTGDANLQKLFGFLADWEKGHAEFIEDHLNHFKGKGA